MLKLFLEYLLPVVHEEEKLRFSMERFTGYSNRYSVRNMVVGVVLVFGSTLLGGYGESLLSTLLFVFGCGFGTLAGLFMGAAMDFHRRG
ncbi:hypothetical protein Tgr7_1807 [Thioalkalivibrio sulfidiphilus HL-EbGr7]|uniref:Uncharacterized protein n=1 Tax=Thioalkalivibrio sulfidiphilus (strain HL-EbGR7) TaxID=396588 RepID=B8GSI5_THISH|nr:hypothetical protein [Thioalkalivibrio sulfidiphilus]ACL72889.1 hypothetical protein Tgr7_1807 [Thioalkalivibrio sulfidiphilus HL-EbGr7]